MDTTEIVRSILLGDKDDVLDRIQNAVTERRKQIRATKAAENRIMVSVGDRGTVTGLRPKYLNGNTVEIMEPPKRTRVLARFVNPTPEVKAKFSEAVRIPLSCFVPE